MPRRSERLSKTVSAPVEMIQPRRRVEKKPKPVFDNTKVGTVQQDEQKPTRVAGGRRRTLSGVFVYPELKSAGGLIIDTTFKQGKRKTDVAFPVGKLDENMDSFRNATAKYVELDMTAAVDYGPVVDVLRTVTFDCIDINFPTSGQAPLQLVTTLLEGRTDIGKATIGIEWGQNASEQDLKKCQEFITKLPPIGKLEVKRWWNKDESACPLLFNDATLLHLAANSTALYRIEGTFSSKCLRTILQTIIDSPLKDKKCAMILTATAVADKFAAELRKEKLFSPHVSGWMVNKDHTTALMIEPYPPSRTWIKMAKMDEKKKMIYDEESM